MSETGMKLTITDIESKQFRREAYGYEQRDVDEFLDCICDEMERLQARIDELTQQLDYARAETRKAEAAGGYAAPATSAPDASFREILEMAQRVKEQTIADAQRKAEEILQNAQAEATATLGSLREERDHLQEIVGSLRSKATAYREAMLAMMDEHRTALDALQLDEEPAADEAESDEA